MKNHLSWIQKQNNHNTNMKSLKLILGIFTISFIITSCHKGGPWGIRGKGDNVIETRDLSGFDRIDLSIDADVYYTQDSIYKVEISAQQNILAVLKSEVNGTILRFDYKRNVWKHNTVKITVHSPSMRGLTVSGSGNITAQNLLNTDNLEMSISGSGNINLPSMNAKTLKAGISGSGDLKISAGQVDSETINVSGSGNVDLESLMATSAKITVSGSGRITVNVSEDLNVSISGSGDVNYRGRPYITSHISGSGRLIHLD